MKYQDYYETLGVERTADDKAIKSAYRKLARKYHPDVSKEANAEEKFKTLGEAYEVLKDPEKRQAYDQLGENWRSGQEFKPPPGWGSFGGEDGYAESGFAFSDFADLFGGFSSRGGFSGSAGGRTAFGLDVHASVSLALEDFCRGAKTNLIVRDPDTGRDKTLRVAVPPNLRDGDSFRLKGQGRADPRGHSDVGDLYVEIRFIPHPHFKVDGDDVYTTLKVSPWEAVLGAKVPVDTLGGPVMVTIPPGSVAGNEVRLKGRGLPGSNPGHQLVKLEVQVPDSPTSREIELFKALSDASSFDPRS